MASVCIIMEPVYHGNRVFKVCRSLKLAQTVMAQAIGINPAHFHSHNPSYWWDKEMRAGGITQHTIGTAGDPAVSGWLIEEHEVMGEG